MRLSYLFLILGLLFISACGTTNNSNISMEEEVETPEIEDVSKIVFLYFDIEKSGDKKTIITLTETQVVPGTIKENTIINAPRQTDNLLIQLLDDKKVVQEEMIIKNPLIQTIEQYGNEGEMNTQNNRLEKSQFYLRFNRKNNIKSIKILNILRSGDIELYQENITI
jgi:hypothetical protein